MIKGTTKALIAAAALGGSLFAIQPAFAQDRYIIDNSATVGMAPSAPIPGIVILTPDQQPRFRTYVIARQVPSYQYQGEVQVGTVLPDNGVTYYQLPGEFGATNYRYTVVNEEPVLVDPGSRRIVQVVEPAQ